MEFLSHYAIGIVSLGTKIEMMAFSKVLSSFVKIDLYDLYIVNAVFLI